MLTLLRGLSRGHAWVVTTAALVLSCLAAGHAGATVSASGHVHIASIQLFDLDGSDGIEPAFIRDYTDSFWELFLQVDDPVHGRSAWVWNWAPDGVYWPNERGIAYGVAGGEFFDGAPAAVSADVPTGFAAFMSSAHLGHFTLTPNTRAVVSLHVKTSGSLGSDGWGEVRMTSALRFNMSEPDVFEDDHVLTNFISSFPERKTSARHFATDSLLFVDVVNASMDYRDGLITGYTMAWVTSAIPEPAGWMPLLAGLLVFQLRRRWTDGQRQRAPVGV